MKIISKWMCRHNRRYLQQWRTRCPHARQDQCKVEMVQLCEEKTHKLNKIVCEVDYRYIYGEYEGR